VVDRLVAVVGDGRALALKAAIAHIDIAAFLVRAGWHLARAALLLVTALVVGVAGDAVLPASIRHRPVNLDIDHALPAHRHDLAADILTVGEGVDDTRDDDSDDDQDGQHDQVRFL